MNTRKKNNWRPLLETLEARRLLSVYADFNGDGRDDLAIGVPGEDNFAGMVQVLYGSATGLTATGSQSLTQGSLGTDSSEAGDNFGASLAGGDFNNDGFTDLAIGIPGEDVGTVVDAGAIHLVFGSASGLTGAGDYVMHQDVNRVRDIAETDDAFGTSLAAGDFNNDGFTDLGVGVPFQVVLGKLSAGGVHIFYGGGQGIRAPGNQTFNLDSPGMAGDASPFDKYGTALAAGDFNGDGRDDLAVGAPQANVDRGGVGVIFGGASGLSPAGSQLLDIPGGDNGDNAGKALAAGDFNNDGKDDLAIGIPDNDEGVLTQVGKISIYEGSATGLIFEISFAQSSFGHTNETNDLMGNALTSGDFDNDGFDDIAIGVRGEDHSGFTNNGSVIVAYGSATGITATGNAVLNQADVGATEEQNDFFGEALAAGDFNGNGAADIVFGTPFETVLSVVNAGAVYVLYGGATFSGGQTWTQDTPGIFDSTEPQDRFGGGLDAGAGGKSAPGAGSGRRDLAQLISADFELDTLLTKPNKRRLLNGRR